MKLLTFLGTGPYGETEYSWKDKRYITCYAPVASCQFLSPDVMVVFATEKAEQAHGQFIAEKVNIPVQFVRVPEGKNDSELWQIFSKVTENVSPGEKVAFDVTHGLRSFPLIGLLVAAYLRVGLNVNLEAVFYGAYDVRDQLFTPHRTPMFELTPMLKLLEWASAADRFNSTGDSRDLASLLQQVRNGLAVEIKNEPENEPERLSRLSNLNNLSKALTDLSQGLALIRPEQVIQRAERLPTLIEKAQPVLAEADSGQPLSLLLGTIVNAYQPLARGHAADAQSAAEMLEVERRMIHWYMEREHWVQAVSLAREWLISWIMLRSGEQQLTILNKRHAIEKMVNCEAEALLQAKGNGQPYHPTCLQEFPEIEIVLGLWKSLTDTRNDIDHAGMRETPGDPSTLIKQIKKYIQQFDNLLVVNF